MPTSSANAKSFSVAPPKRRRLVTGSSVMNVVASERLIVSHSETFAIVANEAREPRDLTAEARRDVLDPEVDVLAVGGLEVLRQLVLLGRRQRLRPDLEA